MSELRPGDRAVVIRPRLCCGAGKVGAVVVIGSRPIGPITSCGACGDRKSSINDLPLAGTDEVCDRRRLLPIPPDDEAKRLFRETEKPREVIARGSTTVVGH